MYYSDVSCNINKTFMKIESLDIKSLITVDWVGIITVSKKKGISIDGSCCYGEFLYEDFIRKLIDYEDDLLLMDKGAIYDIDTDIHVVISPIRVQDNYKVFFVCGNSVRTYDERDLAIAEFINRVLYENVLLNDEIFKEKNYLQNIIDSTSAVIISMDLDDKIITVNRASKDILGYDHKIMMGCEYSKFIPLQNRKSMEKILKNVKETNTTCNVKEVMLSTPDESKKFINLSVSPLNNSKNQIVGFVLIVKDETKLVIYEREIEQLNQFANLGELSTGVAHDIRNPLMGIKGYANIIKKELKDSFICNEYIDPIIDQVNRINDVIEQMLSYVSITKEDLYKLFSINEILERCCNVVQLHTRNKNIIFEKKYDDNIPLIQGNNVQTQQAFVNLLINAIQAITEEGIIRISTCYLKEIAGMMITISDNGIGISEEEMESIFTPFYTTKKDGLGFGLSIVQRVIKKANGRISIDSKYNEGTTVRVFLPVNKMRSDDATVKVKRKIL